MKSKTFRKYIQGSIFGHVLASGHHPQTVGMLGGSIRARNMKGYTGGNIQTRLMQRLI